MDPQLLFMTDEAWYHVSGHVSAQNVSDENPQAIQQVPLKRWGYGLLLSPQ
jgi:hypothetical protein